VCVCIYIYVCVCVFMCIVCTLGKLCMYARMYACIYVCNHICMYAPKGRLSHGMSAKPCMYVYWINLCV
jgi:hypothetical protein